MLITPSSVEGTYAVYISFWMKVWDSPMGEYTEFTSVANAYRLTVIVKKINPCINATLNPLSIANDSL